MPVHKSLTPDRNDDEFGRMEAIHLSDAGGLTQFGVHLETLWPGAVTSLRHWHATEDELLYMLSGEMTLYEGEEVTTLGPGDCATWKAGEPVGHFLRNESDAPATYLIVGSRRDSDTVTYPAHDRVLHVTPDGERFTTLDGAPAEDSPYRRVIEGKATIDGA